MRLCINQGTTFWFQDQRIVIIDQHPPPYLLFQSDGNLASERKVTVKLRDQYSKTFLPLPTVWLTDWAAPLFFVPT